MKMKIKVMAGVICMTSLMSFGVDAKVSADKAAALGTTLTALGAEKAGNGGDIPEYTGAIKAPANYVAGKGRVDPFPDDKPTLVINQSNVDQYKAKLSPGQVAMVKKYTTFTVPVYPTRRSAGQPQAILDITKKNATATELTEGAAGLKNYERGFPFPIPQSGEEVIWNHIVRYRGESVDRTIGQVTPLASGEYTVVKFTDVFVPRTGLSDYDPKVDENILFYFKQEIVSPARLAGNVLLAHEPIDQIKEPRRAWIYNEGQRRVRRAPQVAYDGPGTASDGLRTTDNFDMFNGALDRYDWKLVGKKEMYIPYNSYRLADKKLKYDQIVKPGHINQEFSRYELHRVWEVEATLKKGQRHIYAKRVFYVDEDTWQVSVVDHYDGRGELWRLGEAHSMYFYDVDVSWYTLEVLYDMLSGRYIAMGLANEEEKDYTFNVQHSSKEFTPAALRRSGVR